MTNSVQAHDKETSFQSFINAFSSIISHKNDQTEVGHQDDIGDRV